MAPLRASTTKSEWLPDDPTAFVPTMLWKLPFITTWDGSRNQNHPTDSAEEALLIVLAVSEWTATHKTECGSLRSSVDLTGYGTRPRRPGGLSNAARTDRLARVRQST